MANIVDTEPLIRRENNLAMLIIPLDGPVEKSWREIYDQTAKAAEFPFEVGLTHDLRAVQGGTAAVGSIILSDMDAKDVDAKVKEIFDALTDLVDKVNKEDARREEVVLKIASATEAWYKKKK
ncbi:MAG TPA: hypothetical protein VNF07_13305 [Acidimicrobiales bacterium]|nr:hypothetical protein [Acidimicrobiales bacterium]